MVSCTHFLRNLLASTLLLASMSMNAQEAENERNMRFVVQLDSRNTFVRDKAVSIFGLRGGFQFSNKYELGVGLYGTRLLDFLGREVEKDYLDNSQNPARLRPALIGFEYASLYGEYVITENDHWHLTANSQYGMGRVNIRLTELNGSKTLKHERKGLVEHSIKAKYQLNCWLQLVGGLGYRYLLSGQDQVKKAFNAPIYLISAEIDFRKLVQALKSRG